MTAVTDVTGSIQLTTRVGDAVFAKVLMFFAYKKMLGRIETRTRDRIYCQTTRTVRDISREKYARITTCSLRTPTDLRRFIESSINYGKEYGLTLIMTLNHNAGFSCMMYVNIGPLLLNAVDSHCF